MTSPRSTAVAKPARVVTFGEVMLRLKASDGERLMQTGVLEASYGGAEANVAVSLAAFGLDAVFVTALPSTPIADACLAELRRFDVNTSMVVRREGRMGLYFLEPGAGPRPARVIYDRQGSALALATPGTFDWDACLDGAVVLHLSGVTCAISDAAAALCAEAAQVARGRGVKIVFDLNFRSKLWSDDGAALKTMSALVRLADIAIVNETHASLCLGVGLGRAQVGLTGPARQEALCLAVADAFPNLATIATTERDDVSAGHSRWSAGLLHERGFQCSRVHDIADVVDRVGAGDAFASGLIYGLTQGWGAKTTLDFAAAASCLKNTIRGDFNRVSVAEVEALMMVDGGGRIQR